MSAQLETKCKLAGAKVLSRNPAHIDTRGAIPKQLKIDMCRCVHPLLCSVQAARILLQRNMGMHTIHSRHSEITGRRTNGRKVAIISEEHTNAAIFSYDYNILQANEEWIQVNFGLLFGLKKFSEHNGARKNADRSCASTARASNWQPRCDALAAMPCTSTK